MKIPKQKVVNIYGGPCIGKSTTAAALFSLLKYREVNCEYVQEFVKDGAWEKRGNKFFRAQDYLFANQHFRMHRLIGEVDIIITDSPLLLYIAYMDKQFPMPSLKNVIKEAYNIYENFDVLLQRTSKFNPQGRKEEHTEEFSIQKDKEIEDILLNNGSTFEVIKQGENAAKIIANELSRKGWI